MASATPLGQASQPPSIRLIVTSPASSPPRLPPSTGAARPGPQGSGSTRVGVNGSSSTTSPPSATTHHPTLILTSPALPSSTLRTAGRWHGMRGGAHPATLLRRRCPPPATTIEVSALDIDIDIGESPTRPLTDMVTLHRHRRVDIIVDSFWARIAQGDQSRVPPSPRTPRGVIVIVICCRGLQIERPLHQASLPCLVLQMPCNHVAPCTEISRPTGGCPRVVSPAWLTGTGLTGTFSLFQAPLPHLLCRMVGRGCEQAGSPAGSPCARLRDSPSHF